MIRDRHSGTVPDPPQRKTRRKKQLSRGMGRQPWARARAGRGALGLAEPRGVPKTSWQPRSQRSPLAWLPKARPRVCGGVSVCVCEPAGEQALSRARMALGLRVGLGRGAAPGIA